MCNPIFCNHFLPDGTLHLTPAAHYFCLFKEDSFECAAQAPRHQFTATDETQKKRSLEGLHHARSSGHRGAVLVFERRSLRKMTRRVGCDHVCSVHEKHKVCKRASTQVRRMKKHCNLIHEDCQNRQQSHHMSQGRPHESQSSHKRKHFPDQEKKAPWTGFSFLRFSLHDSRQHNLAHGLRRATEQIKNKGV